MAIYDFEQWIKTKNKSLREDLDGLGGADDPTDQFRFNRNDRTSDVAEDHEKMQQEVAKLVMAKYQPRFMRFLKTLAEENSDQELMTLLHKLDNGSGAGEVRNWKPRFSGQGDEVVPPAADKGIDPNSAD